MNSSTEEYNLKTYERNNTEFYRFEKHRTSNIKMILKTDFSWKSVVLIEYGREIDEG